MNVRLQFFPEFGISRRSHGKERAIHDKTSHCLSPVGPHFIDDQSYVISYIFILENDVNLQVVHLQFLHGRVAKLCEWQAVGVHQWRFRRRRSMLIHEAYGLTWRTA